MKISLYRNPYIKPCEDLTIEKFLEDVKRGRWKVEVEKLRESQSKTLKDKLQAVTISGQFKNRDKETELSQKLIAHSGLICIDIDSKDNPKMSTAHVLDHECLAQFISCRGEGLKIIYKCKPVKSIAEHWRIYDAIEDRLAKKKINIKVDSIVKSIASLQYVTYDPSIYTNFKTRLIVKPLPPVKIKPRNIKNVNVKQEIDLLTEYIKDIDNKDVTADYEDWNNIAFGLTYSLGEEGRSMFHLLSKNYKGYSKSECDEKYTSHLQRDPKLISRPITLATVYDLLKQNMSAVKIRQINKLKGKAVGIGEGEECPDLGGMVRYKLFLFKKILDTKTHELKALVPNSLNLIEFGKLLKSKNIFRYEKAFVKIHDNIVEKVDIYSILWDIDKYIVAEGDYNFQYGGETFHFSWEDIYHLWKIVKAQSSIHYSIPSEVPFWQEDLLRDTATESYIPFQNGVVKVSGVTTTVIPYINLKQQIWKERILPHAFNYTKKVGMFEEFFINVMGRGKNLKERLKSENYSRAVWYYGYMLQGTKDPATARAWMLYDINIGNNGRSGKSIIGEALGKVRYVTVIDGKQVDFRNRFWLQTVKPWTDIIFIDDPKVNTSIVPMFNMITGTVQAEGKGTEPLLINAKFLFASNWIMEAEGVSETGRQFISQLDSFYDSYSKANNDTATPIVDLHGKRFFTEWDANDWAQFYSFSIRCLQSHFLQSTPANSIIGDSTMLQFIQAYGQEMFYDLSVVLLANYNAERKSIIRSAINNVVAQEAPQLPNVARGKMIQRFLKVLGGGNITTGGIKNRGIVLPTYVTEKVIDLNIVRQIVDRE